MRRMNLYRRYAGRPVKSYINVGGGHASLGFYSSEGNFPTGIVRELDATAMKDRGVMAEMITEGVPVINLLRLRELALEYNLPVSPVPLPKAGQSRVDWQENYDLRITIGTIILFFIAAFLVVELDLFFVPRFKFK